MMLIAMTYSCQAQDSQGNHAQEQVYVESDTSINLSAYLVLLQGSWSSEVYPKEEILVEGNSWNRIMFADTVMYTIEVKRINDLLNPTEKVDVLYLCKECRSFTSEEGIPNDEIVILQIDSISKEDFKFTNFVTKVGKQFFKK